MRIREVVELETACKNMDQLVSKLRRSYEFALVKNDQVVAILVHPTSLRGSQPVKPRHE
jgi:hypothetical protein